MIDQNTLLSFSHFFSDERQLEKDYLINLMLKTISVNKISVDLEFKGGTSLYLLNGLDRFSEDLDFTYIGKGENITEKIDSLIEPVIADFSLSYNIGKNKGNIIIRDDKGEVTGIRTEMFIEGPLFTRTRARHKIKIDVSTRNDTIMEPESTRLVSRYPDVGSMLLCAMPVEEVLAEKFCAIIERTKARDIYDAYFMLKYKGLGYNEKIVREKLAKRNEKFSVNLISKHVKSFKESTWKEELGYLVKELPKLSGVKSFLSSSM